MEAQTRLRSAQVHPPPPLTCCVLIQVVFPAGIHLHEHAGVAGWRAQVGAGLLGGAGASVTAVCAGVTVAAAGGCLGGVYGGVDPPWLGWWACRWAATHAGTISGFLHYLILIELCGVVQVTPPGRYWLPFGNRWESEAIIWCAGKVIVSSLLTATNMVV